MKLERIHLILSGNVHGVGFRYFAQKTAVEMDLFGWVRNTPEGQVELFVEGETDLLEEFLTFCKKGPPSSQVAGVEIILREPIEKFSLNAFEIRPS